MILVDTREPERITKKLVEEVGEKEVRFETLPYGDYEIIGTTKHFLIERKDIFDLFKSVETGRLWEQLKGLEKYDGKRILIIEGSIWFAKKMRKEYSFARYVGIKTSVIYGWYDITVIETSNVTETVAFLKALNTKVGTPPDGLVHSFVNYTKEGRTDEQIMLDVIKGFDGVGDALGNKLLSAFGTIKGVITAPKDKLVEVAGEKVGEHIHTISNKPFPHSTPASEPKKGRKRKKSPADTP